MGGERSMLEVDTDPVGLFSRRDPSERSETPAAERSPAGPPWNPPAERNTGHDAALFGHYAEACGPGAIANPSRGTCDAIPGVAEANAAMAQSVAVLAKWDAKVRQSREAMAGKNAEREECLTNHFVEAQEACRMGALPNRPRPPGMTEDECMSMWANGYGGGDTTRTIGRQATTGDSSTYSEETGANAGFKMPFIELGGGVNTKNIYGETRMHQDQTSTSGTVHEIIRPFTGYFEECQELSRAPSTAGASPAAPQHAGR